jgi:hypothetical protein
MNRKLYELDKYFGPIQLYDGDILDSARERVLSRGLKLGIEQKEIEDYIQFKIQEQVKLEESYSQQEAEQTASAKSFVERCPSCNELMPALSNVCSACGFVVTQGSAKELGKLMDSIETKLSQIESIPTSNFFQVLSSRMFITLPVLTIIVCAIGFKLELQAFALIGIILIFLSWKVIKNKLKEPKSQKQPELSFNILKADFEKYSRTAHTYFGENKKIRALLDDLKNSLVEVEEKRKKGKVWEYAGYAFIAALLAGALLMPSKKYSNQNEANSEESPLVQKAEQYINENNEAGVTQTLTQIKSPDNRVLIQSKQQLKQLTDKLDSLEPLLKSQDYNTLRLELSKLIWEKISTDFETLPIERDVYKSFLQRKDALNQQLPKKYRVTIENEYSL